MSAGTATGGPVTRPEHVPAELVVDYDALGRMQIDQAHERFRAWRAEKGPVLWTDRNGGYWLVLDPERIRRDLADPETFDSASRGIKLVDTGKREPLVPLELDGAEHAAYRRLLNPFFAPRRVRTLSDRAREVARTALAEIVPRGHCDVVTDFARPVASTMFLGLMDWPLEDREKLEDLVEREVNGVPGETPEANQRIQAEAMAEMMAYLSKQLEEQRAGDNLTNSLVESTIDGAPIPPHRLLSLVVILLTGGLDTTQSITSQAINLLAGRPDLQLQLRTETDHIPEFVEEILRWAAPVGPLRTALRDVDIAGVRIKAGDRVNFLAQAAARDEGEYPNPDTVDFDRGPFRQLAFGLGPHRCIGAALARTILAVALEEFHAAIPAYRPVRAESRLGAVWGMRTVVVEWDVPAGAS
ncbi:cytochrome P450 [Nocardia harenae]|uniref:cytochrome P450 n=1 Tax=Nocardia harenae TaxID=358707 RepID=UPI0008346D15|nr:cytochrome P450 [Nocardia harenae]